MSIGIIGAGAWGVALKFALSQKNKIFITSRNKKDLDNFVSLKDILKCEYLIITIPAQEIASWLEQNFIFNGQKILVASKGIEVKNMQFLNEIYARYIPITNLCFLSGPSFAIEVMQSLPTALVINSSNNVLAKQFALFFPSFIKTYISDDVIGAEIAGAYKNVIAIASGICEGLKLGKNASASLVSRGLIEMQRFGTLHGASYETFLGLSGAGDLFLSASSPMSRNYRVGLSLAKGKKINLILQDLGEVAEGVGTAKAIYKIAKQKNLYLPIATEVHLIINGKNPLDSLKDLLKDS